MDDVGRFGLRSDDLGCDRVGLEIFFDDVGGCEGVSWRVGGWCLSECLKEGDVGLSIGFNDFEKCLGIHISLGERETE